MTRSDIAIADRLVRRRARMLVFFAMYFMASQGIYFGKMEKWDEWGRLRTIDAVQISAWFAMALALLVLLFTGGGWFRSRAVRSLMNDEGTRDNRRKALAIAFANTMAMGFTIYFLSLFKPVSAREAVYMMMTVGIGSALLAFGMAERRALRDG